MSEKTKSPATGTPINTTMMKLILMIAAFFALMNEVSPNMAFPVFMKMFGISVSTVQWMTTGFMLIMTIVMPSTAFINRRFSTRQIFFTAMAFLTIGTFLSGIGNTFPVILVGRLMQAAGVCITMSLLFNTILLITPLDKRGTAIGFVTLVILFGPALAPTLAGFVLTKLSWRWIFLGLTPIFLVLTLLGAIFLKNVNEPARVKIDIPSMALSTIAFICLLYGITLAAETTVSIPLVGGFIVVGLIMLVIFICRQTRIDDPLINLAVFRYPMFNLAVIFIILNTMLLFSILFFAPICLQSIFGFSAAKAGLIMLPASILSGVLAPFVGRMFDRIGPKPLIIGGIILIFVAALGYAKIAATAATGIFIFFQCCYLAGTTTITAPAQTHGLNQLPKPLYPHGTAVITTVMQFGGALGTALFINIVAFGEKGIPAGATEVSEKLQMSALLHGFHLAFQAEIALLIICFLLALRLKNTSAADHNPVKSENS